MIGRKWGWLLRAYRPLAERWLASGGGCGREGGGILAAEFVEAQHNALGLAHHVGYAALRGGEIVGTERDERPASPTRRTASCGTLIALNDGSAMACGSLTSSNQRPKRQ